MNAEIRNIRRKDVARYSTQHSGEEQSSLNKMRHLGKLTRAAIGAVAAALAVFSWADPISSAQAADVTWRLQTVAGAGTTEYKNLVERFAKYVDELTNGRLKIETFPAGVLMKSPQIADAVSKGTLDIGHTYLVYFSGKEPALRAVNEWPAEVHPMQGVMWFYEGGGAEIMREITAKHNMYFLGVTALLGEQIWAKKPLKSVNDLKGLKIRAAGLAADSFAYLGASVVAMAGEEVYQGLQRGVIDAAEFTTMPVNYGFGFQEVTKHMVMPSYSGGGTSDWIVNMDAWNKLPADLKPKVAQALQLASYEFSRSATLEESGVFKKLKQSGMDIIYWSAEDMRKLEQSRIAVMKEKYTADSPLFVKKLDSQLKFLERIGYQMK